MSLTHRGRRAGRISWAFAAGLAASASFAAGGPARATTLECSPGQNLVGTPPADPRYAVAATMVQFGPMGWRIEHRLANGTIASRNAQYAIADASSGRSIEWRGRLARNPALLMVGGVFPSAMPNHFIYKEWLYDTAKGGVLVVLTQADCVVIGGRPPVAAEAQPAAPPSPPPPLNPDAAAARDKVIKAASEAYDACLVAQMKQVVPYSSESGTVLSQVVVTNCRPQEQQVIDLVMAIYGASRADAERVIQQGVEARKGNVLADIVTFRAELAKSLATPGRNGAPKLDNASNEPGKSDLGL